MDKFFKITESGSSVRTEVIAGLTTFFAMAYIIVVNPNQIIGFSFDVPGAGKIWNAVYIASGTANFLVQFNSMGGTPVQSQSVADGGKATEPTAPTKTGKTFGGWYSDLDLTVAWDFTTDTVDSDMMLYAKWS